MNAEKKVNLDPNARYRRGHDSSDDDYQEDEDDEYEEEQ